MKKQMILAAFAMTLLAGCVHSKTADAAKTDKTTAEAKAACEETGGTLTEDGCQGGGERVGN